MNFPPSAFPLCALLLCAGLPAAAHAESDTDQRVMVVTTDSSAYCRTLSDAIDAHGSLPRDVAELKTQGDVLCGEGRVRGGIVRLRRALLMLNKGGQEAPAAPVQ